MIEGVDKMEVIAEIEEYDSDNMIGYRVLTNRQEILLLIQDYQHCCEMYGYFMSEDDLSQYVGASLLNLYITDTALGSVEPTPVYEGDIMFVNIETDRGLLQFAAYNQHNGYYGHTARVISDQLDYDTLL